jgi:hypothetical protein
MRLAQFGDGAKSGSFILPLSFANAAERGNLQSKNGAAIMPSRIKRMAEHVGTGTDPPQDAEGKR